MALMGHGTFLSLNLFFEENVSFIYSIITLFWNIAYYFSGLSQALKLTSLQSKIPDFLNFVEKYVRLKLKKKLMLLKKKLMLLQKKNNVIITTIIQYAWMWQCKQDTEYASDPEYAKILNMAGFWICQNMPWQSSEYILGSKCTKILNTKGFWICQSYGL